VAGATLNGSQPITTNAGKANAKGIEISSRAIVSDKLTAYALIPLPRPAYQKMYWACLVVAMVTALLTVTAISMP